MVFVLQILFYYWAKFKLSYYIVIENDIIFIGLKPFHMTKWLLTGLGIEYIFIMIFSSSSMFWLK